MSEIDVRITEAERVVALLREERNESARRQAALFTTIAMYQDLTDIESKAPRLPTLPEPTGEKQAPARIGAKRYRMLCAMRRLGHVGLAGLASYGGLEVRKAKYALSNDLEQGFIVLDDHGYCLTSKGEDLLRRFEAYRLENEIELPSLPTEEEEKEEDYEPDEVMKVFKAARSGTLGPETSDEN